MSKIPGYQTCQSLLLLLVTAALLMACSALGGTPDGDRLQRIVNSRQYNSETGQFENPVNTPLFTGRSTASIMYDFMFSGEDTRPPVKLPEDPPPLSKLKTKSRDIRFMWFGHSTILIEIDGVRILIDPIFSDYSSPVAFIAERFQPPVFEIDQIEDIDLVLISHDHYDHLDYETIMQLKDRDLRFIVPLGVGAHLETWGIDTTRITELDWWEWTESGGLKFTCTPAQHFSGRGIFDDNHTLWAGWAIKGRRQNVFFSGDSGYGEHYREIGNRLGPFDLTFLENGAYNPSWKYVHQLPEEGIQAHIDLKGKAMVPIHWGMFDLALHTWHDPIQRVTAEATKKDVTIITPKLGQLVKLDQKNLYNDWWSDLIVASRQFTQTVSSNAR